MGRKWTGPELASLRKALAELISERKKARNLLMGLGVNVLRIDFDGDPETMWSEILLEVNKHARVDDVIAAVAAEYPDDTTLARFKPAPPALEKAPAAPASSTAPALEGMTPVVTLTPDIDFLTLPGDQMQRFADALLDAFPTRPDLEELLRYRLNIYLDRIAGMGKLSYVVFEVLRDAVAKGYAEQLFVAARAHNPKSPALVRFAERIALQPADAPHAEPVPAQRSLEEIIDRTLLPFDIAVWRERLGEVEGRVCRIEIGGAPRGTGFLVGTSAVLTNYHVMESVINTRALAPAVVVRFDYKRLASSGVLYGGAEFKLDTDWLLDYSPYSDVDKLADPGAQTPGANELDYALLRVAGSPGNLPPGVDASRARPGDTPRKWVAIPPAPLPLDVGAALFIAQHPGGGPMQLAIDTKAVLGVNANGTRVRYRTNTSPGSSGSPCFDKGWNLVALHHSGDPAGVLRHNQGVPIGAIRRLLESRGKLNLVGV